MAVSAADAAAAGAPACVDADAGDGGPLSQDAFAELMAALGPWPARPSLAVAVSGGRDSLALTLLLAVWTGARGGNLLALTVDHGLRPDSATEAAALGRRLAARGIAHRVLRWDGGRALPAGAPLQAAARVARYGLLGAACRAAGIACLCLAHQADDQAETLLLRLAAGSGPLGLAGMSARVARGDLLLLRPLLGVPRRRLAATLEAAGESWLDDPANADGRHRRVALRRARPALAAAGLQESRLAAAGSAFGRLRVQLERQAAALLARVVACHPGGYLRLDLPALVQAPRPLARLVLGEAARFLAGRDYPPAAAALDRALQALAEPRPRGRTLAGLRLLPRGREAFLVPEVGRLAPLPLEAPFAGRWGPLFAVRLEGAAEPGLLLRPLGAAGWQALAGQGVRSPLPGPLLAALPALWDTAGPRAVPALGWSHPGGPPPAFHLRFQPEGMLGSFAFTVACRERHII